MNRSRAILVSLLLWCFSLQVQAHVAVEEMAEAVTALLATLSPEQRQKATFEFDSDERFDWHFVPKERKGIMLKELDKKQQALVHEVLDSALSRKGVVKANGIIALEQVLFELENKSPMRDAGKYFLSVFGKPSPTGTWAWRFEGHHFSMNVSIVKGEFVAGTPMFMGANPAEVRDGPKKGTRVLAAEEDLGRKLMHAFDADQRKTTIFAEKALKDIVTGANRSVKPLEQTGIAFAEMNKEQGEILLSIVKEFVQRYRPEIADEDLRRIRTAGYENIFFSWAGGIEPGEAYYYRVQGPTFLLEVDNTQNKGNHIHTVWRDFENDFADDLLKKHYQQSEHGGGK